MKPFIPQKLPLQHIDWEGLIPLMGRVNRSLAYYDGILHGIANPGLLLAPLSTQEAVLSSKIEGTQATLGDVLKYEAGEEPSKEERKHDIQEVMNYRKALLAAEKALKTKPFHLNLLKEMHRILLDSVRGTNKSPGEFRRIQNWIGTPGSPIEQADYVPPSPALLPEYLDNWERYYHMERPDPVVQLAVIHAQFEIIHPFLDGNGRLGRIVIPLFLYEKGLLSRPMFYLSAYFESNRAEYVSRLQALSGDGDTAERWKAWIMFFLHGAEQQAKKNAATVQMVMELYADLKSRCIALTRSKYAVPLLDEIFRRPIFQSSSLYEKKGLPTTPMINNLLNALKRGGILKVLREGRGSRPSLYVLPALVNISEGRNIF